MRVLLEYAATISSALFAGAALYVSVVEHPARLQAGVAIAAAEFPPSYHRGARLQAPLAVVGFVAALLAWFVGGGALWLVGSVLMFVPVPFTLLVIAPVTRQLLQLGTSVRPEIATPLLERWGHLHLVRTILGISALGLFVFLLQSGHG